MSILEELNTVLADMPAPIETGVFSDKAPDAYMVIVPLADTFDLHADNEPSYDVQEVRISIYTKGSYTALKSKVIRRLLACDFTITGRQYIGYETETGYHHYNVDTAKFYEFSKEE